MYKPAVGGLKNKLPFDSGVLQQHYSDKLMRSDCVLNAFIVICSVLFRYLIAS